MPIAGLCDEITPQRVAAWVQRFRAYRDAPTAPRLISWLRRFEVADQPAAARLLDYTAVIPERVIQQGYRSALDQLPGWSPRAADRPGRWFFVGWGGAGESGPAMLRSFREAHNLAAAKNNGLFRTPADIADLKLTSDDTLVFVDDFSGTGKQFCDAWPEMSMLIGSEPAVFLIVTAATEQAIARIRQCANVDVVSRFVLKGKRMLMSSASPLSSVEQGRLLRYCEIADRKNPRGFGGCGLAFVLHHKTPNNCLPVLHVNKKAWKGLFPRYLAGHRA